MIATKDKAFNEIFLSEISNFDSRKYAYDTFFSCDEGRFSKIARQYGNQNGSGALNYMLNTFHSWKSNRVRPNSSSAYNIVASTAATFTVEEKFIEAYTQLAKHIKHSFPKKINPKEINKTFETIIDRIKSFKLEQTTYYTKYIFKGDELKNYESYVQQIFEFYSKLIFENLNKDIPLFKKAHNDIYTAFLETRFHTYLYNIEINIKEVGKKQFDLKRIFDINHSITYGELLNNKLSDFSLEKVSEISKADSITKIDAFLTEHEIEKLVAKKKEIEALKKGGTINYLLKTNSGFLNVKLRVLSPIEKTLIIVRVILFSLAIAALFYYCFILTKSYFIFVGGIILSSFLVTPIYTDILNLFKDIFKPKQNGRK